MDVMPLIRGKMAAIAIGTLAVAAATYAMWPGEKPLDQQYVTAPAEKGGLVQSVSANGTLNPVVLVNVGTQVSGVVKRIYADFNDKVKKGQVLLELDPSLLAATLEQSKAGVANAQASYNFAVANEKRMRSLYAKEYVARQDLDQAVQSLQSAKAQLDQAKAQYERDKVNLAYTVIRSPVSGVVVSREVDVGQTVAASFQTPTLFKIAQNLTRMQIDSSFAEADIGGIRVGQAATFTVDAFPGRTFRGRVRQIRLNPTTQQNVVTYNVVIDVDNDEGILLPGMTAYVSVITATLTDVTKVPNAALRFRPPASAYVERAGRAEPAADVQGLRGTVYLLGKNGLVPVHIVLGASDGSFTDVASGNIKAGDALVVDVASPDAPTRRSPSVRIR